MPITAATVLSMSVVSMAVAEPPGCDVRFFVDCNDMTGWPERLIGHAQFRFPSTASVFEGTAFAISPYAALTSGHCVFVRTNPVVNATFQKVSQFQLTLGQCAVPVDTPVSAFPTRAAFDVRTNEKYQSPSTVFPVKYDYGAALFACPDPTLRTFMPLVFDYRADNEIVRFKGYPGDNPDFPHPLTDLEDGMWGATGITEFEGGRVVKTDFKAGGGSSGSPLYGPGASWQASAVNSQTYLRVGCDRSGGPRFTSKNRDLIRSWCQFVPDAEQQEAAGCPEAPPVEVKEWSLLREEALQRPEDWLSLEDANVTFAPIKGPKEASNYQIIQVIEGGYYEFAVWNIDPAKNLSERFIQLLTAPGEPTYPEWRPGMPWDPQAQGFLDETDARILLSASMDRFGAPIVTEPYFPDVPLDIIPFEVPPISDEDDTTDPLEETIDIDPDAEPACVGDLNDDGLINSADLGLLLGSWGNAGDPAADLNDDAVVDSADLGLMLGLWGPCR